MLTERTLRKWRADSLKKYKVDHKIGRAHV